MKRHYSTDQKRLWNQRYYDKKNRMGWIVCSFVVPKSIGNTIRQMKTKLMAEYKKSHAEEGK